MPATHLISVDLPAPLSPTSAITSPLRTSKSTSVSACTEPNDFVTPRSSRRGVSLMTRVSYHSERWRRPSWAPPPCPFGDLLAVLRVHAVADVALLQEAARDEQLPVRLGDRLRRDQEGGLLAAALGRNEAPRRRLLAVDDGDLRSCGRCRQLPDVL